MMIKQKVLVTGGEGFIGSHLLKRLGKKFEVVSFSSKELDISKVRSLRKIPKGVDIVVNLAAKIDLREDPGVFKKLYESNVLGLYNLLEWSRQRGIRKFVHSSSLAVCDLKTQYALSKKMGEELCLYYKKKFGLNVVILRYSSVYGEGQKKDSVLPIFVEKARNNQDIRVYGSGGRLQDFVYVKDVVLANILVIKSSLIPKDIIYNVCYGKKTSMLALAQAVVAVFGSRSKILFDKSREEKTDVILNDISRTREKFGYKPKYDLMAGLFALKRGYK